MKMKNGDWVSKVKEKSWAELKFSAKRVSFPSISFWLKQAWIWDGLKDVLSRLQDEDFLTDLKKAGAPVNELAYLILNCLVGTVTGKREMDQYIRQNIAIPFSTRKHRRDLAKKISAILTATKAISNEIPTWMRYPGLITESPPIWKLNNRLKASEEVRLSFEQIKSAIPGLELAFEYLTHPPKGQKAIKNRPPRLALWGMAMEFRNFFRFYNAKSQPSAIVSRIMSMIGCDIDPIILGRIFRSTKSALKT